MAKSHFFRNFFKLIFSLVAVALAVISVGFLFGPFVTSASDEVLTLTAAFSISGFNLAFNGEGLAAIYQNGEIIEDLSSTLTLENPSIGTQIGIYLLFAGLLLAIIYLIFCWGHKASIEVAIPSTNIVGIVTFLISLIPSSLLLSKSLINEIIDLIPNNSKREKAIHGIYNSNCF